MKFKIRPHPALRSEALAKVKRANCQTADYANIQRLNNPKDGREIKVD